MTKQELEQKKKDLETEFNKLNEQRQNLLNMSNSVLEKQMELRGQYKMVEEMLKDLENKEKKK